VEGPGGEVVLAHSGLAHGVEEELEVPDDAGYGGEGVVGDKRLAGEAVRFGAARGEGARFEIGEGLAGGVGGAHGVGTGLSGELFDGAVFQDEDGGPEEVGEEASPENDDEDGEVLPEVEAVVGEEFGFGDISDGFAGGEAESEEAAHDAGEDGDGDAFGEGEVRFAGFGFFFGGDFALFGEARGSVDGDGDEAEEDTGEDDLAGVFMEDGVDGAVVDGRDQGSEGGAESEGDGVSEGDAEIADGQAEGEAADPPERSVEEGVVDAGGGRGVEDANEVRDKEGGEEERGDDPCGEALDEPVDLP